MSSPASSTGSGRSPEWRSASSSRSWVSGGRSRLESASGPGTSPSTKSSSEVVITSRTGVSPTTSAATDRYRDSRQTSTSEPESFSSSASSRPLYIGLADTRIAPAFQAATIVIRNCGTFCMYAATRSPRCTPSSLSPSARPSLRRPTSE